MTEASNPTPGASEVGPAPGETPAANVVPLPTAGGGDAPTVEHVTGRPSGSSFTRDQLAQMASWSVEAGSLTREQADAMLKADGIEPPAAAPTFDTSTQEGKLAAELHAAFPPAPAEAFDLPRFAVTGDPMSEIVNADKTFRGWLADGRFTRGAGGFLAEEIKRVSERYSRMDENERLGWRLDQESALRQRYGDDYDRKLGLAKSFVDAIESKNPGLTKLLHHSGAGNSAIVIGHLVEHASRLQTMAAGRKK